MAGKSSCLDCHAPAHPELKRAARPMSAGSPLGALRLAILLTAAFNVLAVVVLVRDSPIAFTVFMFAGLLAFAVALILLVGAVLADLSAKKVL